MNQWTSPVPVGRPLHLHELNQGNGQATKDPSQATDSYFSPYTPGGLFPSLNLDPFNLDLSGLQDLINSFQAGTICAEEGAGGAEPGGSNCVACMAWDDRDESQWFNTADTAIDWQWTPASAPVDDPDQLFLIAWGIDANTDPPTGINDVDGSASWTELTSSTISATNFTGALFAAAAPYSSVTLSGGILSGNVAFDGSKAVLFDHLFPVGANAALEFVDHGAGNTGTVGVGLPEAGGAVLVSIVAETMPTLPSGAAILTTDTTGGYTHIVFLYSAPAGVDSTLEFSVSGETFIAVFTGCDAANA